MLLIRTKMMFPTFTLFTTLLFLSPSLSYAQYKTPLFVFGDSLYDDGMTLYNGVKGAGAEYWPYGETYFKKPAGRYSDGRLIPDFIAQFAGLPFLPPYLKPGLKDYTKGINFASAGACVLVELRPQTINLKRQIDYFVQMVGKLKQQVGEAQANKLLSEAVYLFNIAGNDWVTLLQKNVKKLPLSNYKKNRQLNMIIGNLTTHFKFLLGNLPPQDNIFTIWSTISSRYYLPRSVNNILKISSPKINATVYSPCSNIVIVVGM